MYETLNQKRPVLDVKGLEVVRRDGCPALVKIMDQSLRILFRSLDMSQVGSLTTGGRRMWGMWCV